MAEHSFDCFVEDPCLPFYEPSGSGRPSIPEGDLIRHDQVPHNEGHSSTVFIQIDKMAVVKGNSKEGFVTLHDLRRNFGSRWAGKVRVQILPRMMRLSSISITMDFYSETKDAAIEIIWSKRRNKIRVSEE